MRTLILAAACLLIAADAPPKDASADDLEALQGVWKVVTMETSGKILPQSKFSGMTVTIKGDRMKLVIKEATRDLTIQLDAAKDPKQITVTAKAPKPRKAPKTAVPATVSTIWLYRLSGDDLRICGDFTGGGAPPPPEMNSIVKGKGKGKGKTNYSLVVFQRKKTVETK